MYTVSLYCVTLNNSSENVIKMENSLNFIFDEIWPMTLYYSTGTFTRFLSNLKNL